MGSINRAFRVHQTPAYRFLIWLALVAVVVVGCWIANRADLRAVSALRAQAPRGGFQFTLGTLLIAMAIVGVIVYLVNTYLWWRDNFAMTDFELRG